MKLDKIFDKIDDHLLEAWNSDNEYNIDCIKAYLKDLKEAINYTRCCETVKDKYIHTFEVDLNSEKRKEQYNKQIEQIHNAPCKVYFYDGENYIELKP
tara:strand:+ start:601 stop:894 length:294 start_codon:yes stop_codon:yes gene_type:complete